MALRVLHFGDESDRAALLSRNENSLSNRRFVGWLGPTAGLNTTVVASLCVLASLSQILLGCMYRTSVTHINLLKPTGHVMHQQFNIQQLYVLPTLYLCVLYLSENKPRHVPLTA